MTTPTIPAENTRTELFEGGPSTLYYDANNDMICEPPSSRYPQGTDIARIVGLEGMIDRITVGLLLSAAPDLLRERNTLLDLVTLRPMRQAPEPNQTVICHWHPGIQKGLVSLGRCDQSGRWEFDDPVQPQLTFFVGWTPIPTPLKEGATMLDKTNAIQAAINLLSRYMGRADNMLRHWADRDADGKHQLWSDLHELRLEAPDIIAAAKAAIEPPTWTNEQPTEPKWINKYPTEPGLYHFRQYGWPDRIVRVWDDNGTLKCLHGDSPFYMVHTSPIQWSERIPEPDNAVTEANAVCEREGS